MLQNKSNRIVRSDATLKTILVGIASLLWLGTSSGVLAAEGKPTDWYPSRYGADDTIGAANNLSSAGVLEALSTIHSGRVYSLAIETGKPEWNNRPFPGRDYHVMVEQTKLPGNLIGHDDKVTIWMGLYGTSMDGLGHVGVGDRFYNGNRATDIYAPDGLRKLAVSGIPPIVTRGVLLDIPAWKRVAKLPPSMAINRAEIDAVAKFQRVTLRRGDVILIHTGWQSDLMKDPSLYQRQPGLGVEGARYLANLGVVAIGSDNHGLEVFPAEDKSTAQPFPVHPILLAENGVYILEDVRTDELARDKAYTFLFVLGQPRLLGTVQAAINPIAIR